MEKKHLFIGIGSALGVISATFVSLFVWKSVTSGKTSTEHFVTFESYGGTHIESQRVEDGKTATPPSVTPTRGDDTFLGWFTDFEKEYTFNEPVTKDITLYAGWDVAPEPETTHSFKFTGTDCSVNGFKEFNCNVLIGEQPQFEIVPDDKCLIPDNITVVKGQNVSYTKENGHGYIKITNMTSDVEITASAVSINYYTFSFTSETCTIDAQHTFTKEGIQEGTTTTFTILPDAGHMLPETIEIPEEVKSFTTYQNGVITITNMSGDVTLSNVVAPAKTYTVTWLDYDGKAIQTDEVVDGGAPTKPDDPVRKSSDPFVDYKFKGWVPEISEEVHNNQTYVATYQTLFYKDTKAYMHINTTEDNKDFTFTCSAESNITIDWGDGTPQESKEPGTISHTYAADDEYNIRILNPIATISVSSFTPPACTALIEELYLGKDTTTIGENAFYKCSNLKTVTFEEGSKLTSISDSAFRFCSSLASIDIPSGVISIGWDAFERCSSLTKINIPSEVTFIGFFAFQECSSLQTVAFEENSKLESIASNAFFGCSSLNSIFIPATVKSIDNTAFDGCSNLGTIVVDADNSVFTSRDKSESGKECDAIISIVEYKTPIFEQIVPANTLIVGGYKTTIPDFVTSIDQAAFSGCSSLTKITIPSGLTSIGAKAFKNCSGLQTVIFEENSKLESIGDSAFYGCSSLTSIIIPSAVTSVASLAFQECSSLQTVAFEEGSKLDEIGGYAFYGCANLKVVDLTALDTVPTLGGGAFNRDVNIYVKADMVETFKAADEWQFYANNIFPGPVPSINVI